MTATLADVREGIKAVLQTVDGINNVYGYNAGSPTPPCAVVEWPSEDDAQVTMNSETAAHWLISVLVLVGTGEQKSADLTLGALREPIIGAFNDSPVVATDAEAIVATVEWLGAVTGPDLNVQYLAARFHVDVIVG